MTDNNQFDETVEEVKVVKGMTAKVSIHPYRKLKPFSDPSLKKILKNSTPLQPSRSLAIHEQNALKVAPIIGDTVKNKTLVVTQT